MAIVVALLLVLVALPLGMTGHTADCPACTSAEHPFALGLCAGLLAAIWFAVSFGSTRVRSIQAIARPLLLTRSIYRPPRFF